MMIISDLLAVAMLIIVNLLIMIDMVTISSRSVPAGDNVKTAILIGILEMISISAP